MTFIDPEMGVTTPAVAAGKGAPTRETAVQIASLDALKSNIEPSHQWLAKRKSSLRGDRPLPLGHDAPGLTALASLIHPMTAGEMG